MRVWHAGDLVSAAKLNAVWDDIDALTGLGQQRVFPVDAGANLRRCDIYERPASGVFSGRQVDFWFSHNGDTLKIQVEGGAAYVYWRWDGASYDDPTALIQPGALRTIPLGPSHLAGLYQYQPVRVCVRSVNWPTDDLFVTRLWQTDSNAPAIGALPTFANNTTSSAADMNTIETAIANARANLLQPVAMNYCNDDRIGSRNNYVGYIRHTHDTVYVDVTTRGLLDGDSFVVTYNGVPLALSPAALNPNTLLSAKPPSGLTWGEWYRVEAFVHRPSGEQEQHMQIWSIYEAPFAPVSYGNTRWQHGGTLHGNSGGPPQLDSLSTALGLLPLRWINQPCRTVTSTVTGYGYDPCGGSELVDGLSGYRVHRWLTYQSFRQKDGNWATPTLQWQTGGRNLQTYSLPHVDVPSFFDLDSSPIKPGMWFGLIGAAFGVQTPIPGIVYA